VGEGEGGSREGRERVRTRRTAARCQQHEFAIKEEEKFSNPKMAAHSLPRRTAVRGIGRMNGLEIGTN